MLHKNKKLTKRLLELKSERYRLSLNDRIKKFLLKKYNIPYSESELIDNILFKQGHLKYENYSKWTNEFNQTFPIQEDPFITEQGLNALRNNYYEYSALTKKAQKALVILNIIALSLNILFGIKQNINSDAKSKKLKIEIEAKNSKIDSLKNELKLIRQQNNSKIKQRTSEKDSLPVKL